MINRTLFTDGVIKFTAIDPEKDAETISTWSNSPAFVQHYFDGFFHPLMPEEISKKMKEMLKKANDNHAHYYFALREVAGNRLVGLAKLGYVVGANQSTWISIDLVDAQAFQDFGRPVLDMVLDYAFLELSLHKVGVQLPAYSKDEIALYEEAGFLRESQRRQAVFFEGRYHDELVYGLLKSEWKMRHQEVAV